VYGEWQSRPEPCRDGGGVGGGKPVATDCAHVIVGERGEGIRRVGAVVAPMRGGETNQHQDHRR
jgi:hypothetical protein